jgi:ABC-2 type transport system permease protein
MTSTTATPSTAPAGAGTHRPLFVDVLRSEWTKMRSVRSTYRTLAAAAILMVGLGALLCSTYVKRYDRVSPAERLTFDPTSFSLAGLLMAQLAIGVLGVLMITNEYSTGMIRTTFVAVPQRRLVLAAKALVFTVVTLVVGLISSFAAFLVGQSILRQRSLETMLSSPGVLRAVVGASLYLTVFGLLGLGLGAVIRHTAGGISTLFALIFVVPGLVQALPTSERNDITPYLPSDAGGVIFHVHAQANELAPWSGFGLFCLYALAVLVVAGVLLTRRDA